MRLAGVARLPSARTAPDLCDAVVRQSPIGACTSLSIEGFSFRSGSMTRPCVNWQPMSVTSHWRRKSKRGP